MNYQLYELLFLFAVYGVLGWFGSICMLALSNGRYPEQKDLQGAVQYGLRYRGDFDPAGAKPGRKFSLRGFSVSVWLLG